MKVILEREEGGPVVIYGIKEFTVLTNKGLTGSSINDEQWDQGFRFSEDGGEDNVEV